MSTTAPTQQETARLRELEAIVNRYHDEWRQVATALTEIRDSRLYRFTHKTFAEYVDKRFGFTVGHAYKLIRAEAAAANVSLKDTFDLPTPPTLPQGADAIRLAELETLAPERKRKVMKKRPKAIYFKGKGWTAVLHRKRHDIDPEACILAAIEQMRQKQQKEAA